jgi:DNA-binding transcriptional MerR regulator/methylmalonyl-CoA mutase cobalamin-binding subunit
MLALPSDHVCHFQLTVRHTYTGMKKIASSDLPTQQTGSLIPIGRLERQTGIPQATLRMWEKRYGFPRPLRDENGHRVYPQDQVERLRGIRALLDKGVRPGKIFSQPPETPYVLEVPSDFGLADDLVCHAPIVAMLRQFELEAMRAVLKHRLLNLGLSRFVIEVLGPLTTAIGAAWQAGCLPVRCEHAYARQVTALLSHAMPLTTPAARPPTVVLATLTGESHALGLLMVEAVLVAQHVRCIPLGPDTPLSELAATVQDAQADIAALSFSAFCARKYIEQSLEDLRSVLPESVDIWCGGEGAHRLRSAPPGVRVVRSLSNITGVVSDWRRGAKTGTDSV